MRRFLPIVAALALLPGGCGGANERSVVSEAERRVGAEQHEQLLAEFGGAYDARQAAYVARLGETLGQAADLGGQCTFTLVNSDVVNAFAVPGCYIYVTRGLMGIVNSEDELASVLAHEVAHIVGDHSSRQRKRSVLRGLGVAAVSVLTQSERLSRIAERAATFFTLRYSRGQEYQADDLGLSYLVRAGYDPGAAADMLDALTRQERYLARTRGRDEARGVPEWARTHPLTQNRVARARKAAAATGVDVAEREDAYLRAVDGLLYGDDPQQGFVEGRRFAHPGMRIAFEAPAGFTLTNSPQAIAIEGPDGQRGEFAGGAMPRQGVEAYAEALLRQMLGDAEAEVGPAERVVVGGVPAVFVPAAVATPEGPVSLSVAAYDGGNGGAYHFVIVSGPGVAPSPALRALFGSFRRLTDAQAASLRPRRLRVVRAGAGDTVRSLAARMATQYPAESLAMLNARGADDPVRAGEAFKIVSLADR